MGVANINKKLVFFGCCSASKYYVFLCVIYRCIDPQHDVIYVMLPIGVLYLLHLRLRL